MKKTLLILALVAGINSFPVNAQTVHDSSVDLARIKKQQEEYFKNAQAKTAADVQEMKEREQAAAQKTKMDDMQRQINALKR